jgi:cardiolipin synthase A/B
MNYCEFDKKKLGLFDLIKPLVTMSENQDLQIKMFSDPLVFLTAMLTDIKSATRYIYLEIYRFRNDPMGIRFRDNLIQKCRQGVEIKLLIDSWGASSNYAFFRDLIDAGGEVKFFKKIRLTWDAFTKNHRRDHRKILIIDDHITYIGSANISSYSINWRESVFRIKGDITKNFKEVFFENIRIYNKFLYDKISYTRKIRYDNFQIIRDVPSLKHQPVQRKYLELIQKSKRDIYLETPYFLPGSKLRKALMDAAERGVKVNIIIPKNSDIHALDILAGRYFGELWEKKVNIFHFMSQNLHSKIFLVDRTYFMIGSSNFDYRSFRYQHEICLFGEHKSLNRQLINHFNQTLRECVPFNYHQWKRRPLLQRILERLLVPFRHLF